MRRALAAAAAAAALLAGCASTGTLPPAPAGTVSTAPSTPPAPTPDLPTVTPAVPAPLEVSDPGRVTGTLAGRHCHVRGEPPDQLPDPACTPGAYDPKVTAAILCNPAYTTRVYRPPASGPHGTTRFKYDQAYPAYGIPAGTRSELDHSINLDLAGANDAANLWPEAGAVPNPKDAVEGRLHRWVCAAHGAAAEARLRSAQRAIAADWRTALAVTGAA